MHCFPSEQVVQNRESTRCVHVCEPRAKYFTQIHCLFVPLRKNNNAVKRWETLLDNLGQVAYRMLDCILILTYLASKTSDNETTTATTE